MKDTYTCPDSRCPRCGARLTGALDPTGEGAPSGDDLSVCTKCAAVLVFNHDLTLRPATPEDLQSLSSLLRAQLRLYVDFVEKRNALHARH